ncbi:retrovirus-related Pol polyprotein from transposon 412 [Trichonephila clavipes]|nr:retrovirus-related Pol polyprotein from transposon 412 [Trichonephila clavipes]
MKDFSTIARPLHYLTEAKHKFIWTNDCSNTFNKLKETLTSAPVLAYPEIGRQFVLDTDASHESIGAVLFQEIDGQERDITQMKGVASVYPNQKETARYCKSCGALPSLPLQSTKRISIWKCRRPFKKTVLRAANAAQELEKFAVIDPVVRQVTALESHLWNDESVRKDQLADCEIKLIMEFKESSDEKPSWPNIASFH